MTWSIVARGASGAFGVGIATRFFAVGALCPHSRAGVAALSTQGLVNPLYGPRGLDLLERGDDPATVVAALIAGMQRRNDYIGWRLVHFEVLMPVQRETLHTAFSHFALCQ